MQIPALTDELDRRIVRLLELNSQAAARFEGPEKCTPRGALEICRTWPSPQQVVCTDKEAEALIDEWSARHRGEHY